MYGQVDNWGGKYRAKLVAADRWHPAPLWQVGQALIRPGQTSLSWGSKGQRNDLSSILNR